MGQLKPITGQCLCGSVRFEVTPKNPSIGACHCSMCRRWSGGVFLCVDCGDNIELIDDTDLTFYKSSDYGERGFCKKCGTSLFWKMQQEKFFIVSVSSLDDTSGLTFDHEIFIDEKPEYYGFANPTKKMTGEEVFAAFAEQNQNE